MADIDNLQIKITSEVGSATRSIGTLINKLDGLQKSLNKVSGANLTSLSIATSRLSQSLQGFNSVDNSKIRSIATSLNRLGNVNVSGINNVGDATRQLSHSLNSLNNVNFAGVSQLGTVVASLRSFGNMKIGNATQNIPVLANGLRQLTNALSVNTSGIDLSTISEVFTAISKLGGKMVTNATNNLPQLTQQLGLLFQSLSRAPTISNNTVRVVEALGRLSSSTRSVVSQRGGLASYFNTFNSGANKAAKSSKSLAHYIGKLYASYWMLFRVFNKLGSAITYASDLTEVQNVVDKTFGEYRKGLEDFVQTSIQDYGISELTSKQIASRFQAMGTAMGVSQKAMSGVSLELTKLSADMASFYNLSVEDVAEDLESIFTGQTKPLRQYGLDITEATLKEWALKEGLDADMDAMTQAEKANLRYQYILANTTAAQGDFADTADTWANQVKILKENFKQLGAIIGQDFINMLKPAIKALNQMITMLIKFANVVSNSLGVIFGWKYEDTSGGVLADTVDDAMDLGDSLDNASDSAKKLKKQLQGFDELNNLSSNDGGSGSGTGISATTGNTDGGEWVKADKNLLDYMSDLDTLYKLGDYIATTIGDSLENIDWDSVYQGSKDFGSGLASFLNGLINVDTFGTVGKTIANSLNTSIYTALAFSETLDWTKLGEAVANGINEFFANFDFGALAEALNSFVSGIVTALTTAIKKIKWSDVIKGALDFATSLDLGTIAILMSFKWYTSAGQEIVKGALSKLMQSQIALGIGTSTVPMSLAVSLSIVTAIVGFKIGNYLYDHFPSVQEFADAIAEWLVGEDGEISIGKSIALTVPTLMLTVGAVKIVSAGTTSLLAALGIGAGAGATATGVTAGTVGTVGAGAAGAGAGSGILAAVTGSAAATVVASAAAVAAAVAASAGLGYFIGHLWDKFEGDLTDNFLENMLGDPSKRISKENKKQLENAQRYQRYSASIKKIANAITTVSTTVNTLGISVKELGVNFKKELNNGSSLFEALQSSALLAKNQIVDKWSTLGTAFKNIGKTVGKTFSDELGINLSAIPNNIKNLITQSENTVKQSKIDEFFNGKTKNMSNSYNEFSNTLTKNPLEVKVQSGITPGLIGKWCNEIYTVWDKNKPLLKPDAITPFSNSTISSWSNNLVNTWNANKPTVSPNSSTPFINDTLSKWKNGLVNWWNSNKPNLNTDGKMSIKIPQLSLTYDTKSKAADIWKKLVGIAGEPKVTVNWKQYANGGFPEDGWFRASHGEYMGQFDDGTSVIANNNQIIQGINSGVAMGMRSANAEQNMILKEQNDLLRGILAKETGITSNDIFRAVRRENKSFYEQTGNNALVF